MSFIFGFIRQTQEVSRLKALEQELKSAKILGEKHCVKCGFCCHRRACIPTPSELKKIAKFLELTPKKLIKKYYVIDRRHISGSYHVKPVGKNIKDLVGRFIPNERTFNEGKCIFLGKNNLCKIYPVRPESARNFECWKEEDGDSSYLKLWEGNQLLKQFKIDGDKMEKEILNA